MSVQNEQLLEALVDLERVKERERESRFESEVLLEGLRAITVAANADRMFSSLLEIFSKAIGFDDAFILVLEDNALKVIATTDPIFRWTTWTPSGLFQRVLAGSPVALFDIARAPEWSAQPPLVKERVKSALHGSFYTPKAPAVFVCVSQQPSFFAKRHIHLLQRFSPLASQAMISLEARELIVKQEALEQSRYRLESIIATVPIGLLHFHREKVLTVNKAFRRLFRRDHIDAALPVARLLAEIGLPDPVIDRVRAGHSFANLECSLGIPGEDSRIANVSLSDTHFYDNGEERLLVIEDITDRKSAEETLRYSAFQAGVAEMATSILHNIGNSITGIVNRARRLRRGTGELLELVSVLDHIGSEIKHDSRKLPQLLEVLGNANRVLRDVVSQEIEQSSDFIGEGVEHIAEIITIQQGVASPERSAISFSLARCLEEAVAMQRDTLQKYSILAEINVAMELAEVTLPRNQLLQAVINLVKNSREAIQERTDLARAGLGRIVLNAKTVAENRFALCVADNGCGLECERLAGLFRFGYSSKQRGTGYGLHWVANFVRSLGGIITAHSPGRNAGMEIRIELPIKV